ncbi:MAG: hypothetical protein JKP98_08940 [Rhodobacteraceae bacterium]|nr:hypothetical protein [Paracoccaceae bacterium]MBL4557196.1 hypothetical protein [Paracoccaceae bacterium]
MPDLEAGELAAQLPEAYGDASVLLPDGMARPGHWAKGVLTGQCFEREWTAFKPRPGGMPA